MTPHEKGKDLIERYVHEIGRMLPSKLRDDIQVELRSLLLEAAEERTTGGRPFDEDLAVELLREFGEPKQVAARYKPEPEYLVGPELYPAFRTVMAVIVVFSAGVVAMLILVAALRSEGRIATWVGGDALFRWLSLFVRTVLSNLGIAVIVFFILQRLHKSRTAESRAWDPRALPVLEGPDHIVQVGLVVKIYFIVLFAVMLNFFSQWVGVVVVNNASVRVYSLEDLGVALPVAILNLWWLLALALNMMLLRMGRWTRETRWLQFGLGLFGAGILYMVLARSGIAELGLQIPPRLGARLPELTNRAIMYAFGLAIGITLLESLVRLYRLLTRYALW